MSETKICLWCKKLFVPLGNYFNQKYCQDICSQKYNKMQKHIGNNFFGDEFKAEICKLEQLGINYVLPKRSEDY